MKLWVDDERPAPIGWLRAQTYWEATTFLRWSWEDKIEIEEISLDHDLACGEYDGYALVKWMVLNDCVPPVVRIHSMNPVGAENMAAYLANWTKHTGGTCKILVKAF